jgi:hypothetical protein
MALALMVMSLKQDRPTDPIPTKNPSVDTFVPVGYVLVTLQLINSDSIDSMIGQYSMVDLYPAAAQVELDQGKTKPIATRLRLIRAPNNPELFGVLVSSNEENTIQQLAAPVFGVIRNPNSPQPQAVLPQKGKKLRSIQYGEIL